MSSKAPDTTRASQITADASRHAADLQAASEAENRALQERLYQQQLGYLQEQDKYNRGLTATNQENWNPFINVGREALGSLSNAVNDVGSWFNQQFDNSKLAQDEGYQFRMEQGQNRLDKSMAAQGGLLSGAALKAAQNYGQGVASEEYNNAYARFTNDKNNRYNALNGLVGLGVQGTAGFQQSSIPTQNGAQMANVASNFGNTMGNIIQSGSATQSNIAMANANAQAQLSMAGQQKSGGFNAMGVLGGAATGAKLGSMIPGVGTAIGAVVGGLAGLL